MSDVTLPLVAGVPQSVPGTAGAPLASYRLTNVTTAPGRGGSDVHVNATGRLDPGDDLATIAPGESVDLRAVGTLTAWCDWDGALRIKTPIVVPIESVPRATGDTALSAPFVPTFTTLLSTTFDGTAPAGLAGTTTGAGGGLMDVAGGKWSRNNGFLIGTFSASDTTAWKANALVFPTAFRDGRIEAVLPKIAAPATGNYVHDLVLRRQANGDLYFCVVATSGDAGNRTVLQIQAYKTVGASTSKIGSTLTISDPSPDYSGSRLRILGTATGSFPTTLRLWLEDADIGNRLGDELCVLDSEPGLQLPGQWGLTSHCQGSGSSGTILVDSMATLEEIPLPQVACVQWMDSNGYGAGTSSPGGASSVVAQLATMLSAVSGPRAVVMPNTASSGSHVGDGAGGWAPGASSGLLRPTLDLLNGAASPAIPLVLMCLETNSAGSVHRYSIADFIAKSCAIIDAGRATVPNVRVALFVAPSVSPLADNGAAYYDAYTVALMAQYDSALDSIAAAYPDGNVRVIDKSFRSLSARHFADWYREEVTPSSGNHFPSNGKFYLHLNDLGSLAWATQLTPGLRLFLGLPNGSILL